MRFRVGMLLVVCLVLSIYLGPTANSSQWQAVPASKSAALPNASSPRMTTGHPEQTLVEALNAVRQNRLGDASKLIDALLQVTPNYRLAHLVKGDLLMAQSQPLRDFGSADLPADTRHDLRQEALVRLQRYALPLSPDLIPANLLQMDTAQRYAVVVDASRSRLFVYRNEQGVPRYVNDFYVTVGKLGIDKVKEGDQRTPLGVYFVTGQLAREKLDKSFGAQADLYGVGAWPLSYPNEWDRRVGRTGHGIWLHGSPADTYSRPPQASNGCVVLTNPDMVSIAPYLLPGTPVVISPNVEWLDRETWQNRRNAALQQLDAWRKDWESLDPQRYFAHYGQEFTSGKLGLAEWKAQKIQINNSKSWVKVRLEDVSLFAYPSSTDTMLMANFSQHYDSNNLQNRASKRLYWKTEQGSLKIVHEGSAG